jgi:hypothetical protein
MFFKSYYPIFWYLFHVNIPTRHRWVDAINDEILYPKLCYSRVFDNALFSSLFD